MDVWGSLAVAGVGLAAAGAGGFSYAANWPASQIFGRTVIAGNDPNEIALTYDDGPNPAATPELLEVLARHQVKATFFLIGDHARVRRSLVRATAAEGHIMACHTMSHPHLSRQSEKRIRSEITDSQKTVEDIVGQKVTLFRPPYGSRRPAVMRLARELGMSTVMWNCIVGDWEPVAAETLLGRMEAAIANNRRAGVGTNIVLHDGGQGALGLPRMESVKATDLLLSRHREDSVWVTPARWV